MSIVRGCVVHTQHTIYIYSKYTHHISYVHKQKYTLFIVVKVDDAKQIHLSTRLFRKLAESSIKRANVQLG